MGASCQEGELIDLHHPAAFAESYVQEDVGHCSASDAGTEKSVVETYAEVAENLAHQVMDVSNCDHLHMKDVKYLDVMYLNERDLGVTLGPS